LQTPLSNQALNKWLAFSAIALVTLMINIDATVVNLALVSISKTFHTSLSEMQWVINIYMLTNIMFIILAGRLADILGRKKIYIFGIILFVLGSIGAGCAFHQWFLIGARAIQGLGFAFTLSLGVIMASSLFPPERKAFALGCYMTVAGIAQAIGPSLGGIIIQCLGWRWIFLINVPLGVLAIILVSYFFKPDLPVLPDEKIRPFEFILLTIALTLFVCAFNELGHWGFLSIWFLTILCLSLIFFVFFYFASRQNVESLIDFSLFKNKRFMIASSIRALQMYAFFSVLFCLPIYLQNIIGYSPFITGLFIFCLTAVFGFSSFFIGAWLDRVGIFWPLILSAIFVFISLFLLAQLGLNLSIILLIIALLLFGFGKSIMSSGGVALNLDALPKERLGVGMAISYGMLFLSAILGVAISGSLISLLSVHHLHVLLFQHRILLTRAEFLSLRNVVHGAQSIESLWHIFSQLHMMQLTPIIKECFVYGFSRVMYFNAFVSLLGLCLTVFLKDKRKEV